MHNNYPIPFQGICQGGVAGPTIWFALSSSLIEMMRETGHGIKSEALLPQYKDILLRFLFVENTDIMERDLTNTEITIEYFTSACRKPLTDGNED